MLRTLALVFILLFTTTFAWAVETEPFDPEQPFQQAFTSNLLRSLLNQALDALEDHLEITGNVDPDDVTGDRSGSLRFKFYPDGKSKSDQHLTAEGSFHFSLEGRQHDWHFRFKLPEDVSKKLPLRFEEPL